MPEETIISSGELTATTTTTTVMVNADGTTTTTTTLVPGLGSLEMDNEDDDDGMSDGSEGYDDGTDFMTATMEDEVTAQLAAAGPVGMAAAAAIASAKKRKRPHQFETNPSIRKRQQTRLLRKLRQTIDEFTIRVGMQAVVLVTVPGKTQNSYKCFGAKPLEDVIRNLRPVVMQDLESSLAQHAPAPAPEDPSLHELPPLVIDGIPTPVEKMTQAQLRAFIPLMLKYSTGRGKPGWGKESTRPPWWPQDLPWANVRMDARTEDEKQKVSWTHALRQIVINCYKYHGREDLLPVFSGDNDENVDIKPQISKLPKPSTQQSQVSSTATTTQAAMSFTPTVLQTISNPDGTVSIIQVDPTNSIITLPDGTTAQVQGVATLQNSDQLDPNNPHGHDELPMTVDLSQVAHTITQDGQIIITSEDGHSYPVTVSGMITVPMQSASGLYQTVVASLQGANGEGVQTVQTPKHTKKGRNKNRVNQNQINATNIVYLDQGVVTPMVMPKVEPGTEETIPVSALTGDPTQTQLVTVSANGTVIHNDKVYQLCEYLKPEGDKVVMMAQVTQGPMDEMQEQMETDQQVEGVQEEVN